MGGRDILIILAAGFTVAAFEGFWAFAPFAAVFWLLVYGGIKADKKPH